MAGEVITIQAGHLANYTGSHFWNIQVCQRFDSRGTTLQGVHLHTNLHVPMQDELLGLAELPETAALARQIDPTVLFRERETGRVRQFPSGLNVHLTLVE